MGDKHIIKLSAIVAFFQDEAGLIVRGENALESGHVLGCQFDADLKILKGSVHASMRDRKYDVQIDFTGDWGIKEASCTCPRGQHQCHHMVALLLAGHYNVSVTDASCSWHPKAHDAEEEKTITDLYPPRPHKTTKSSLRTDEIEDFMNKLSVFDGAVGFTWLLSKEPPPEAKLVADIEDVIFSNEYLNNEDKKKYFVETLQLTQETI